MTKITHVRAREVLDSRGHPTVEVEITCDDRSWGRAIVPSGASTSHAEACELRDGDPERYDGRGVTRAVSNVTEKILPALAGIDPTQQARIDALLNELDGTAQKTNLGANAMLGVSLAAAHTGAAAQGIPLYLHFNRLINEAAERDGAGEGPPISSIEPRMPLPMTNMISGGLHAGGNLDFQDFLIMPSGAASYATGLEWIVRVYRRLGELLDKAGYTSCLVGDEGGYGPRLKDHREALDFLVRAIEAAGLRAGENVTIALDVAASHFFDGTHYHLRATGGQRLEPSEMIDLMAELVDEFPIASIEDPLSEEDWDAWQSLTERLGDRIQIVGDDLFATNPSRLAQGIEHRAANSVLVKMNQIGTLSETFRTLIEARRAGFKRIVSARSGETEDTSMADLAVGAAADQIKIGSVTRSERLAKYNQLLRLEEELG